MKLDEQIDTIMDEFDFDRVHTIMEKLNWKWGGGKDAEVPHVSDIRKTARRMLKDLVYKNEFLMINGGGFSAMKVTMDDESQLYLFFGVDSTSIEFADNDNK